MGNLSLERFHRYFSVVILLLVSACVSTPVPNDDLTQALFMDAKKVLQTAKDNEAIVYAPKTFAAGMNAYEKAEDKLKRGGNRKDLEKNITSAVEYFTKSVEIAQRGKAFFSSVITARQESREAEAGKYATDTWDKAEIRLGSAIKALESESESSARAEGLEAETLYREAELISLEFQCLGEARLMIKKAAEADVPKKAPITFEKSTRLVQQAKEVLEKNRHDVTEAKRIANQAQYEVQHATYLSQTITRMAKEKKTIEEILLEAEPPLQTIANALGKTVWFDQGVEPVVQEITDSIQSLK